MEEGVIIEVNIEEVNMEGVDMDGKQANIALKSNWILVKETVCFLGYNRYKIDTSVINCRGIQQGN